MLPLGEHKQGISYLTFCEITLAFVIIIVTHCIVEACTGWHNWTEL